MPIWTRAFVMNDLDLSWSSQRLCFADPWWESVRRSEKYEDQRTEEGASLWRDAWKRLRRNKLALAGAAVIIMVIGLALAGPTLVFHYNGFTYETQDLTNKLAAPSRLHPLGTDMLGRDL